MIFRRWRSNGKKNRLAALYGMSDDYRLPSNGHPCLTSESRVIWELTGGQIYDIRLYVM